MTKRAVLWVRSTLGPGMEHQKNWCGSFARGLKKNGWEVVFDSVTQKCDLFVIWGTRRREVIVEVKNNGSPICVIERGFIGDRFENCMVGLGGGLNGRAEYPWIQSSPERFEQKHRSLLRETKLPINNKALLIGQVAGDASIKHLDIDKWYIQTAKTLQDRGWRVYFRPHPCNKREYPELKNVTIINGNLYNNFDMCSLVVTMNSNTGVDAVLYGMPTVTSDAGSMAYNITLHDIPDIGVQELQNIYCYDRFTWANELAWTQFDKKEMESGFVFDQLKQYI